MEPSNTELTDASSRQRRTTSGVVARNVNNGSTELFRFGFGLIVREILPMAAKSLVLCLVPPYISLPVIGAVQLIEVIAGTKSIWEAGCSIVKRGIDFVVEKAVGGLFSCAKSWFGQLLRIGQ